MQLVRESPASSRRVGCANLMNIYQERASFCLVFRSLNTTSSHRMFSMGYRRAKSTQGNTNFQKRIFLANNSGITTRGP